MAKKTIDVLVTKRNSTTYTTAKTVTLSLYRIMLIETIATGSRIYYRSNDEATPIIWETATSVATLVALCTDVLISIPITKRNSETFATAKTVALSVYNIVMMEVSGTGTLINNDECGIEPVQYITTTAIATLKTALNTTGAGTI